MVYSGRDERGGMADWRQQAARAVEAELEHARRVEEWTSLGRPRKTTDGTLVVDLRGKAIDLLEDIRLAGDNGPREGAAVPVKGEVSGGVLWLRETGTLPPECGKVWVRQLSPHDALARLARGLRDIGYAPLADRLAAGELDPADDPYEACLTPGVRLVWGPPGTGKSRIASSAVAELARAGKRVLHVTAADNRVEAPTDPERVRIQDDLAELASADSRLAYLDDVLAGYDHDAFLEAERRLHCGNRARVLEAEYADARRLHAETVGELADVRAFLWSKRQAWACVADERVSSVETRALGERLARLDARLAELGRRLSEGGRFYRGRRRDRKDLLAAEAERDLVVQRIEQASRRARKLADEELHRLENELAAAHARFDEAARAESRAHAHAEQLRGSIVRLRAGGVASEQDERFHAECVRRGLPGLHAERERLRERSKHRAALRGRFEERLWWIGERAYRLRGESQAAAWESGRVVRTSLDRHVFTSRPFDVVLIDDAGSAPLADVLLAVAQARETAVVFGDFNQPPSRRIPHLAADLPEVRSWTLATPFSHCGIESPADARAHPGCAVLTTQFRFGPSVRTLANATGYEVLAGGDDRTTEVVLLDTTGSAGERAALAKLVTARGGAVFVPEQSHVEDWLRTLRDAPAVSVGTAGTVVGHEFGTVVLDLTRDDWRDHCGEFASAVARARDRLFLLADLEAVKSAAIGTPLGAVNALRLQSGLEVCRLGELFVPRQRRQSAIDRHVTVTNEPAADGTMSG